MYSNGFDSNANSLKKQHPGHRPQNRNLLARDWPVDAQSPDALI
jgi:hypothetical protein